MVLLQLFYRLQSSFFFMVLRRISFGMRQNWVESCDRIVEVDFPHSLSKQGMCRIGSGKALF